MKSLLIQLILFGATFSTKASALHHVSKKPHHTPKIKSWGQILPEFAECGTNSPGQTCQPGLTCRKAPHESTGVCRYASEGHGCGMVGHQLYKCDEGLECVNRVCQQKNRRVNN
ncbi:hypothetical protein BCR33DRAFT_714476 [Rhizoclosmatium globosum]|uniref:Dickkopf N-terminal cysteine-rich domain-containing protein n=1 Tax=Rhizoclosmatium globosum TaxID=329046 RepID=A0A1Y2CNX9_9FUNG|nr:hypothetical protein BCR33DRAFT_714476 [Rhizoclosmatium globosum]|eukprot:ORY48025.1 hypothetical protein BCR33DRAFT_714476 [Rhizoclosmatium globosum]